MTGNQDQALSVNCRHVDDSDSVLHVSAVQQPVCSHCHNKECSLCLSYRGVDRTKHFTTEGALLNDDHANARTMLYETPPPIASKQSHRNKKTKKELMVEEISILALSKPPWEYRDEATGIRVPPCTTRVLRCHAKPNWNDQPLLKVLQAEFIDFSRPEELEKILHFKLLRVNGKSLDATDATTFRLKSGDLLSRILHWHEAPVIVPARIDIQRVTLPSTIVSDYQLNKNSAVYVCDKPSSVPVHPAGPYFSNTLTLMLEAQENLQPASLIPLHRTDRVTSGLTLLCNDPKISRIFHLSFSKTGFVRKLYIAKVKGRFNVAAKGVDTLFENKNIGEYRWDEACETVEVLAPVETVDPANGLRAITSRGKPARSVFRLIHYESSEDASYLACYPISGRNHQLRVHLSWLGYPIIGDVQYGGVSQGVSINHSACSLLSNACCASHSCLPGLSVDDINSAKLACARCNGGKEAILQSLTPAQLLCDGHAIHLHALRYKVDLIRPTGFNATIGTATVEFKVALPSWAKDLEFSNIEWLKPSAIDAD